MAKTRKHLKRRNNKRGGDNTETDTLIALEEGRSVKPMVPLYNPSEIVENENVNPNLPMETASEFFDKTSALMESKNKLAQQYAKDMELKERREREAKSLKERINNPLSVKEVEAVFNEPRPEKKSVADEYFEPMGNWREEKGGKRRKSRKGRKVRKGRKSRKSRVH